MKLLLLKYFFLFYTLFVQISFAQTEQSISFECKNENLRLVLEKISSKTNLTFVFSDQLVDSVQVNIKFKKKKINEALELILKESDLSYKYSGEKIIIIFRNKLRRKISLYGKIIDAKTEEEIPFANVYLNNTGTGTSSNSKGYFTLGEISLENSKLVISSIGYEPANIILTESFHQKENVFQLRKKNIFTKNVIIKGEASDIINVSRQPSLVVLSVENFSSLPILGEKDISRTLQLLPGISSNRYGSAGLNIRGGKPSENLVLLDGILLYNHSHSFGFFNSFNSDAIKDVRIYKGGFPAKYGNRLSGVLELTSRGGNFTKPNLKVSVNPINFNVVGELPVTDFLNVFFAYRKVYREKFLIDIYERVYKTLKGNLSPYKFDENESSQQFGQISNDDVNFDDVFGKITLLASKNNVVSFNYYAGNDNAKTITSLNLENYSITGQDVIDEKLDWNNVGYSVKWFSKWNNKFFTDVTVSASEYKTENEITNFYQFIDINSDSLTNFTDSYSNKIKDLTVNIQNEYNINWLGKLEFGYSYNNVNLNYYEKQTQTYYPSPLYEFEQDSTAKISTVYVQNVFNVIPNFTANAGLRITRYNLSDKTFYEPRFSFVYNFNKRFSLKGAYGKFYQFVMEAYTNELSSAEGQNSWVIADNDYMKPASSVQSTLGFQYCNPNLTIDLELYYKKNVRPDYITGGYKFLPKPDYYYGEDLTTYSKGIDLMIHKKRGKLNGWISYSYGKSTSEYLLNFVNTKFDSDLDIRHNIKTAINYNYKNFVFSLTWQYLSGLPYSVPEVSVTSSLPGLEGVTTYIFYTPDKRNEGRLPAIKKLDASVSYFFKTGFLKGKVGLSVFNLLNNDNVWFRFFKLENQKPFPVDVKMIGITPTLFFEFSL